MGAELALYGGLQCATLIHAERVHTMPLAVFSDVWYAGGAPVTGGMPPNSYPRRKRPGITLTREAEKMTIYEAASLAIDIAILILELLSYLRKDAKNK